MSAPPRVGVIILNWNGKAFVRETLDGALAQDYPDFFIVVVDNGSTDGSREFIAAEYGERVDLILLPENTGYGAGNNHGIDKALAMGADWVALLNNDAVPEQSWLTEALAVVDDNPDANIGMIASKVLLEERGPAGEDLIDTCGHLLYPDGLNRGRGRLEPDTGQYDAETDAFFPSGAAGLYSAAMLRDIGLFEERLFAYGDDTDLGLRGVWAGYRCAFAPTARVRHKYSMTAGAYSPMKAFYVERNRVLVAVSLLPRRMLVISPWYSFVRYVLQAYGALTGTGAAGEFVSSDGKLELLKVFVKSLLAALDETSWALGRRWRLRTKKKIDDAEFIHQAQRYVLRPGASALKP